MPGQFLTQKERQRLNAFPPEIETDDLITFFTLTESDKNQIPVKSSAENRLGFALQLGTIRYMGFCPEDILTAPANIVTYTAQQLEVPSTVLSDYGRRQHTRSDHVQKILKYLGFRRASSSDFSYLSQWLLQRALEHDKPTLLLQMTCERLYSMKIVRPGITTLERMVVSARQQAQQETYKRLSYLITDERKELLDNLLIKEAAFGRTPLFWLRCSEHKIYRYTTQFIF